MSFLVFPISSGVILYVLRDASYEEKAQAIYNMRTYIRGKYADVRMRSDILRELWAFVESLADGAPMPAPSQQVKSKKKGKDKRRTRDDDDDDEMSVDDDNRPKKQSKKKN